MLKKTLYFIILCLGMCLVACNMDEMHTEEDKDIREEVESERQEKEIEFLDADDRQNVIDDIEDVVIFNQLMVAGELVKGYQSIDLNEDGVKEVIVSLADIDEYHGHYFVIDKANSRIDEFAEVGAAATVDLYIDEVEGRAIINRNYSTVGYTEDSLYVWNDGWNKIATAIGGANYEESYIWGDEIFSDEEWRLRKENLLENSEIWENVVDINNQVSFEYKSETIEAILAQNFDDNGIDYEVIENQDNKKILKVYNYMWAFNQNLFADYYEETVPLAFVNGYYQPATTITVSNEGNKRIVEVYIEKLENSFEKSIDENELEKILIDNIWYSFDESSFSYNVYKFNMDGTLNVGMLDETGYYENVFESLYYEKGNTYYNIENGKIILNGLYQEPCEFIYINGVLTMTYEYYDAYVGESNIVYTHMIPSKYKSFKQDEKFVEYMGKFNAFLYD